MAGVIAGARAVVLVAVSVATFAFPFALALPAGKALVAGAGVFGGLMFFRWLGLRKATAELERAWRARDAPGVLAALRRVDSLSAPSARSRALRAFFQGTCYLIEEDFESAKTCLEAVSAEHFPPEYVWSLRLNRVFAQARSGDDVVGEAQALVDEARAGPAAAPDSEGVALLALGFALLSVGRATDAVPAFERAEQTASDLPVEERAIRAVWLGDSRRAAGASAGAREAYERAVAIAGRGPAAEKAASGLRALAGDGSADGG